MFTSVRNSSMSLGYAYFWTNTIHNWQHLLANDFYKQLIVNQLKEQVEKKQIKVFAFVIMPNHMHLVWQLLNKNGKEMPHASFNKATGHLITRDLKEKNPLLLQKFKVNEKERAHRIWQRDPLAVLMDTKEKMNQKIRYIHNNPRQEHWNLSDVPENYPWSSSAFYEGRRDFFGFVSRWEDYFD